MLVGASNPSTRPHRCAVTALFERIWREPEMAHIHVRPCFAARRMLALIVVFDIGNVLLRWNPRNLYRKTFTDEERMERFLATALGMDFVAHTDIAADFSGAIEARAKEFPEYADELRLFDERWVETLGGPIEENVALLRRLKAAGRPVHALSNFAAEKFAVAREQFDFLNEFDTAVISGHVGAVKPHPRIYEILFAHTGRRPDELLFIDDSPANVRASEALGMAAIHFRPGVDLESELAARGALP
jgi:HAD superfamily hydrolase (TIGR01509 family)